jgi:hypothetical protein
MSFNEQLFLANLPYFEKNRSRFMRLGKTKIAYSILVGKPEGKRPLGRPKRRWVDNIKMDLRETGWDGVDWIELDRTGSG